jgi:ribosomal protein S18 acetylase RimI-like enzyme
MLASARPGSVQESAGARYLDLFASGEFDRAGLFVAFDEGGAMCGAMLAQSLPGALGLAWPPRAERGPDQRAVEDELVAAACGWVRTRGVKVCQVFGAEDERADLEPLERGGFSRITQVTHLRKDIEPGEGRSFDPASCPLAFDRYDAGRRETIAATLLATYEGSLDCPELNGSRTADELLAGFTGPLPMQAEWWFLAHDGGEPVGVVLLDAGIEPGVLELSYLGLVPPARGRGWGEWMLKFSVDVAIEEGCRAVTTSVDVRNEPARRLYARHGFRECDRRDVYLIAWDQIS